MFPKSYFPSVYFPGAYFPPPVKVGGEPYFKKENKPEKLKTLEQKQDELTQENLITAIAEVTENREKAEAELNELIQEKIKEDFKVDKDIELLMMAIIEATS